MMMVEVARIIRASIGKIMESGRMVQETSTIMLKHSLETMEVSAATRKVCKFIQAVAKMV